MILLWVNGSYSKSNFVRSCKTVFQSGQTTLQSYQQWMKISVVPRLCQHLLSSMILDFSQSNTYIMVSNCGFNLHFFNDKWCGGSFHVFTCHLYIFFGEVYGQVFCAFNWAICFLIIESTIKSTTAVIFIFKGTWVRFLHIQ